MYSILICHTGEYARHINAARYRRRCDRHTEHDQQSKKYRLSALRFGGRGGPFPFRSTHIRSEMQDHQEISAEISHKHMSCVLCIISSQILVVNASKIHPLRPS